MKKIKVRITFTEAVLGTWPSNQNIAREFIASKSPDAATVEDEVAALGADAVADKGMTVFPRNENGEPILYDYQIKGILQGFLRYARSYRRQDRNRQEESGQRIRQADSLQEGH